MSKKREPIPDNLLLANGVWDLEPTLRISSRQVAMLTELSEGMLKERRRTRPPQPPLPIARKKGSGVWYPLGEVLAFKANGLVRPIPRIKRPTGIKTFAMLLEKGAPEDTWPFARLKTGQLVDFFAGLRLGDLVDHQAEDDGWMTLDTYLKDTSRWSESQRNRMAFHHLSVRTPRARSADDSRCRKCGRPDKAGHVCRL